MQRNDGRWNRSRSGALRAALMATAPTTLALAIVQPAIAQAQTFPFNIESQPLSSALLALGRQAGLSVLAPTTLVEGRIAPSVRGDMSAVAALEQLLDGSGLAYVFVQPTAVKIVMKQHAEMSDHQTAPASVSPDNVRDRVVVTGTNIPGVSQPASPITVYSQEDIARTGAVSTEQFVGKMPQNLGNLNGYATGASVGKTNLDAVTAIDLRGLGVGTTLTLLNGRRMALSSGGRTADVSFIPMGAIDRVEVLTDGASAIYGSDAIGGVVNFILRKDFQGAETRLSYSGVTEGGLRQGSASQTVGGAWDSGHGLASYTYNSASPLMTSDRDYAAGAGEGNLTSTDIRHSAFAMVSQEITGRMTLDADIGANWRKVKNAFSNLSSASPLFHTFASSKGETRQVWGDLALDYRLDDATSAGLSLSYSEVDIDAAGALTAFNRAPPLIVPNDTSTSHALFDATAKVDGTLFELASGSVRYSVGGGLIDERFKGASPLTLTQTAGELGRRTTYGFGEIFAPLADSSQNIPFLTRLSLSLAARYTGYEDTSEPPLGRDFGDAIDPKIGIQWSPVGALGFRATYGTSFRAPSVSELDMSGGLHGILPNTIDGSPGIFLALAGYPANDLKPETAETYTLGFDYTDTANDLRIAATFYSINYTDRIGLAPEGGLNPFADPSLLPDILYRAPSVAFIEDALRATKLQINLSNVDVTDPQAGAAGLYALPNFWIYDSRFRNLAVSRQRGIDYSISKGFSLPWADLQLGVSATNILSYEQKASSTSPTVVSVDRPGQLPDWRVRGFGSARLGDFSSTLNVNYVDDYANPSATSGSRTVEGWTTFDLAFSYRLAGDDKARGQGTSFSLSIQNVLDEDPPSLRTGAGSNIVLPVGFDPANANPLGRFIAVGVTHTW